MGFVEGAYETLKGNSPFNAFIRARDYKMQLAQHQFQKQVTEDRKALEQERIAIAQQQSAIAQERLKTEQDKFAYEQDIQNRKDTALSDILKGEEQLAKIKEGTTQDKGKKPVVGQLKTRRIAKQRIGEKLRKDKAEYTSLTGDERYLPPTRKEKLGFEKTQAEIDYYNRRPGFTPKTPVRTDVPYDKLKPTEQTSITRLWEDAKFNWSINSPSEPFPYKSPRTYYNGVVRNPDSEYEKYRIVNE